MQIYTLIPNFFPTAMVHYPLRITPIFMYFHNYGLLTLLVTGILYLISGIKGSKKIIFLGFVLGMIAWALLLFSNINSATYLKALLMDDVYLKSLSCNLKGYYCYPVPNSYIYTRIRIAYINCTFALSGLVLGTIDFILTISKKY